MPLCPTSVGVKIIIAFKSIAQFIGCFFTDFIFSNMMNHTDLWAKTADDKTQKHNFHPVICHLLDTAAICQHLLTLLPPATIDRLGRGLKLDRTALLAWAPFLTGSHDTGKISPPFQFRDSDISEVARKLAGGSLYDLWFKRPQNVIGSDPFHGTLTACTLPEYLKSHGVEIGLADELSAVVGGHHGIFPKHEEVQKIIKSSRQQKFHVGDSNETPQWRQWRKETLDVLADYCGIIDLNLPQSCDAGAAVILASITTFSDWLASDQKKFPPAGSAPDLDEYIKSLPSKVEESLSAAQWQKWQPHDQPLTFSELFSTELFSREPRGLQTIIEELMPEIRGKATLLIVEAPTGEGKTEAALTVAHWHTSSGMPGTYIGMPTQATGNALYNRLKEYLNKWYADQNINFQLIHSASKLNDDFSKSICRLSNIHDPNYKAGGVSASEWFVSRKKALLAPWGVGTVDAALMGILRKKHQFLYLLGLTGKTVILDEVHAYDGYTSQLLDRLIHWCAILGSPVVILSATLNKERRQSLLNSYAEGLGLPKPELPLADYPRLTIFPFQNKAVISTAFTKDKLSELNLFKEIKIRWIDESEIKSLLGKGATAIIRSTVRRCQSTASDYPQAEVFHSRFTQEHRLEKESECLSKYGEPKDENEPARPPSLLVATQVIEQSLNVDFDVLISDLCPIDLLIQRIGRLWRFKRNHRGVPEKIIYLIDYKSDDGLPNFGKNVEGKKVKNSYRAGVYDRHCLLRTYYWLKSRESISLPQDIDDAIEQVYDLVKEPNSDLTEVQYQDWSSSLSDYQIWQDVIKHKATGVIIPDFKEYVYAENLTNRDMNDKDAEMVTRLIDNSMKIIIDLGDGKVIQNRMPQGNEINQILRQQVQISDPGLIRTLEKEIHIPKYWQRVPYLRDLRVLNFNLFTPTTIGSYSISYDRRLGLSANRLN
jgi:CRISPR-associated endonuclease/helicase Cas3